MELFDVGEYKITLGGDSTWIYKRVNATEEVGIHLYNTGEINYLHFVVEDGVTEECDYLLFMHSEVGEMWVQPINDIIQEFKIKLSKNAPDWSDRWTSMTIKRKKIFSTKEK